MISFALASSLWKYDPEKGTLQWIRNPSKNKHILNTIVQNKNSYGYIRCIYKRKTYLAHRVAWLLHYGYWPIDDIDHINRVKCDNRIKNLRVADKKQNARNKSKNINNSYSIYKGVTFNKSSKKWQVSVSHKYIGLFNSEIEAAKTYAKLAREKYGDFFCSEGCYLEAE